MLVLGKIFLKNKPVALFVVVGGIVASALLGLEARGVKLLGEVPQGLPALGLPAIHWADLNELLPLALACFLLGAVETAAIGRMFAAKHGGRLDANQEFLALAASNLAAGLGRGFPVSGGMSQSLVNEGGGARTPLSGAFAAGIILVVVLFFSHLLRRVAPAGAGRRRAGGGGGPVQGLDAEATLARRSHRVRRGHGGARRRARARACCAAC